MESITGRLYKKQAKTSRWSRGFDVRFPMPKRKSEIDEYKAGYIPLALDPQLSQEFEAWLRSRREGVANGKETSILNTHAITKEAEAES